MDQQKRSKKFSKIPDYDFSVINSYQKYGSQEIVKDLMENLENKHTNLINRQNFSDNTQPSRKFTKSYTISPEIYTRLGLAKNVGEYGKGVRLADIPSDIQEIVNKGWQLHEFNELVSDLIALNRSLPEPRSIYCRRFKYSTNLPKTSVIIIFHNEAWSTLLRTIHSVLNRSPEHLVQEVLLVDDFSNMGKSVFNKFKSISII